MNGKQRIAVAGATGRVGRDVADVLETQGHEVVAISRSYGVDLISGDGLADALAGVTTQLVAARTVAEALADLAAAPASQEPRSKGKRIPEIAGPREESLVEMAKLLVARRGEPVLIEGANAADLYGVDVKELGALLQGPDATLAGPTFEDWLGEET
jgi:uncharacterized protein YbjT (DUF2867 family)